MSETQRGANMRQDMRNHEHFESFDPTGGRKWSIYCQRFVAHCATKNLTKDAEMKAEFIASCSDYMIEWTERQCWMKLANTSLTFADIKEAIENHGKPRWEIRAASKFHGRNQQRKESVHDFVSALRSLARECNFGAAHDRMLRDRIVLGIRCDRTRELLFNLPKDQCTVENVVTIAYNTERVKCQEWGGFGFASVCSFCWSVGTVFYDFIYFCIILIGWSIFILLVILFGIPYALLIELGILG
ncbi:uncharacterized protein LOC117640253 [Thrips palmi]|uniref:Uncharacterized protein LOC117640253 n=1 Tax=Thrips palmi TaxID=161013 RepID=A0A6P8Y0B6_THRPL|nr:uncharacterized protein LOC117640253 [Thrips palmi]